MYSLKNHSSLHFVSQNRLTGMLGECAFILPMPIDFRTLNMEYWEMQCYDTWRQAALASNNNQLLCLVSIEENQRTVHKGGYEKESGQPIHVPIHIIDNQYSVPGPVRMVITTVKITHPLTVRSRAQHKICCWKEKEGERFSFILNSHRSKSDDVRRDLLGEPPTGHKINRGRPKFKLHLQ